MMKLRRCIGAGTIAGTTYGVAKSATVVGVKVLDAAGAGMTVPLSYQSIFS